MRGVNKLKHIITDHILLNTNLCIACGSCIDACPKKVLGKVTFLKHEHVHVDQAEGCIGCQKCVKTCPQQAIIARRDIEDQNAKSLIPPTFKRQRKRRQIKA